MRIARRFPRHADRQRVRDLETPEAAPKSDGKNFGRFLEMARPYRGLIAALIFIGVVRFALPLVTPWSVRVLQDEALKNVDHLTRAQRTARLHQVHWVAVVLIVALVARVLILYYESILTGKLGNRHVFDLRRRLY